MLPGMAMPMLIGRSKLSSTTTLNPADKASVINLTAGNLVATSATSAHNAVRATLSKASGALITGALFSVALTALPSGGSITVGVGTASATLADYVGSDSGAVGYIPLSGGFLRNGSSVGSGPTSAQGDVISVGFDGITVRWFKNGTLLTSYVPSFASGVFPMVGLYAAAGPINSTVTTDFAPLSPSGYTYGIW